MMSMGGLESNADSDVTTTMGYSYSQHSCCYCPIGSVSERVAGLRVWWRGAARSVRHALHGVVIVHDARHRHCRRGGQRDRYAIGETGEDASYGAPLIVCPGVGADLAFGIGAGKECKCLWASQPIPQSVMLPLLRTHMPDRPIVAGGAALWCDHDAIPRLSVPKRGAEAELSEA